jgi:hypothetical protein
MPVAILNNFFPEFAATFLSLSSPPSILPELNFSQHGLAKSKSTVTNLVTFLHFVAPAVCSQDQTDLFM